MLFSYGSGCASSIFRVKVLGDYSEIQRNCQFAERLDSRRRVDPIEYTEIMNRRRQSYGAKDVKPKVNLDLLFEGTFYLTGIDSKFRRTYACKGGDDKTAQALKRLNSVTGHLTSNKLNEQVAKSISSDFHKKTVAQRQETLQKILPKIDKEILKSGGLSLERADYMIENCYGVLALPLGLGTGFKVNGTNYVVPMAVEEPSVITACSVMGKLISKAGGFTGGCTDPVMISQI